MTWVASWSMQLAIKSLFDKSLTDTLSVFLTQEIELGFFFARLMYIWHLTARWEGCPMPASGCIQIRWHLQDPPQPPPHNPAPPTQQPNPKSTPPTHISQGSTPDALQLCISYSSQKILQIKLFRYSCYFWYDLLSIKMFSIRWSGTEFQKREPVDIPNHLSWGVPIARATRCSFLTQDYQQGIKYFYKTCHRNSHKMYQYVHVLRTTAFWKRRITEYLTIFRWQTFPPAGFEVFSTFPFLLTIVDSLSSVSMSPMLWHLSIISRTWLYESRERNQNDRIFLQMAQPRTNSSPVGGWSSFKGHCSPPKAIDVGPAGHFANLSLGECLNLPASSWHLLQKCVVPKQKKTASEQQYLHLYSTNSAPWCWQT